MANIRISQLPVAPSAITGTELVPIVQNGQTVQTTVADITNSPVQTQTFLTVSAESSLPNSRYIAGGLGIGTTDGGAQGPYSLFLNGTSASLENASTGLIVKSASNTIVNRSIAVGTAGLSVADGSGVSGNPTLSLTGLALSAATLSGSGMVSLVGGSYFQNVTLTGTTNQISILNPNGGSNPTFSIADNPIIPGLEAMTVPSGATGDRPAIPSNGQIRYNTTTNQFEGYQNSAWATIGTGNGTVTEVFNVANQTSVINGTTTPTVGLASNPVIPGLSALTLPKGATADRTGSPSNGMIRYNTDTGLFEGYSSGAWTAFSSGSGVTSVATGTGLTGGPITSTGTISIDTSIVATLTGVQTLTNKSISGATNTLTSIPNASLDNSSITINGSSVSLGGSITVTATATNALTIGTGLTGTSYNGSTPVTITIDSTVITETNTKTLSNKSISGSSNTLTNIPNSALTNSSVTIGTTAISLGGSSLTLGGLTSVAVTQDPTTALELATKQYVDTLYTSGIHYHQAVKYEVPDTTGNLNAIYNQPGGSGVGVGATLTNNGTLAAFAPDGPTASIGDRVLIYNQTNQFENGVYTVTIVGNGSTAWVLTRATDADTYNPTSPNGLGKGDAFFVTSGNTGAGETYECNTVGVITFGTTAITFVQISSSQVYSAGTGLTLSGTQFSITNTGVSAATYGSASSVPAIAVNAQGQITSAVNTSIAINANQVTSGTLATTVGGTGLSSFTSGGALYATSTSALTTGTLPIASGGTGITAFGTGVQTALGQNVSGSGSIALTTSPTFTTPVLGTPTSGNLANCTGYPTSALSGSIDLATQVTGTLAVSNGGTGVATLTGVAYGNGTSAFTAATGTQIATAIGSTAVTNATNAANLTLSAGSGSTNYLTYAASATGNAPQYTSTGLTYNATTNAITGGITGGTF